MKRSLLAGACDGITCRKGETEVKKRREKGVSLSQAGGTLTPVEW